MKSKLSRLVVIALSVLMFNCTPAMENFDQFPHTIISNNEVEMKVYLPDPEKGLYRATRFDWSGVIGSVQYKGHEYFGYWKETHDPLVHEDLMGPVEGFIEPGLGYIEAQPGGKFIRIGVGIIEKVDETEYNWRKTYKILDHGKWKIEHGKDWISFTQELDSDIGYSYVYKKTIKLKSDGFIIEHMLQNSGEKTIETDQFNHNFFMIDGEQSGPPFTIRFPYPISTDHELKGILEIDNRDLHFVKELADDNSVFVELDGYSKESGDHQVTIINKKSGAGVTYTVNKPLFRMVFWACKTTLSPENSIWIRVEPGALEEWTSDYTLFVE